MGLGPRIDLVDDLAHRILDEVVSFSASLDRELPSLRYVSPGLPPWDIDQVTVHYDGDGSIEGDLAAGGVILPNKGRAGFAQRSIRYVVQVVRCVPSWSGTSQLTARRPPVEMDEAVAKLHNGDSQMVRSALINAGQTERLPDGPAFYFGEVQSNAVDDMVGMACQVAFDQLQANMLSFD